MTRSHIVCSTTCLPNTALIFRYLFASVRIEVNNSRYCGNGHRSEKGGHIFTSILFPFFCIGFCKIYSAGLMCEFLLKLFMDFVAVRDGGVSVVVCSKMVLSGALQNLVRPRITCHDDLFFCAI